MQPLRLSFFLANAFAAVAMAGPKPCTFRVHLQANARDSTAFASTIRSHFSGKDFVIEKTPAISERDILAFRPYPGHDGTSGALLQLDDHGRTVLDALSIEHRGTLLFVFLNGRPITELQVDRRVSDGKIYLPNGLGPADLAAMRKRWPLIGTGNGR
jgi:hypothetical protein